MVPMAPIAGGNRRLVDDSDCDEGNFFINSWGRVKAGVEEHMATEILILHTMIGSTMLSILQVPKHRRWFHVRTIGNFEEVARPAHVDVAWISIAPAAS